MITRRPDRGFAAGTPLCSPAWWCGGRRSSRFVAAGGRSHVHRSLALSVGPPVAWIITGGRTEGRGDAWSQAGPPARLPGLRETDRQTCRAGCAAAAAGRIDRCRRRRVDGTQRACIEAVLSSLLSSNRVFTPADFVARQNRCHCHRQCRRRILCRRQMSATLSVRQTTNCSRPADQTPNVLL